MTAMLKVVILADSNALARGPGWGNLKADDTYPRLLQSTIEKKTGVEVFSFGESYRGVREVLRDWRRAVEDIDPHIIVIQIGGSDCAPRMLLP